MEVLECDRCHKRIGEKGTPEAKAIGKVRFSPKELTAAKVSSAEKALCAECTEKLQEFLGGSDDVRRVRPGVSSSRIESALQPFVGELLRADELGKVADAVIAALPNGGTF